MSSKTYSEAVPFKIDVWKGDTETRTSFPSLDSFLHYLEHTTCEHEYGGRRNEPIPRFEQNGWELQSGAIIYERLCPELLTKYDGDDKDLKVYYINESEYASGGSVEACFFADERSTLERFCDDWGFNKSMIVRGRTVQQTL